MTWRFSDGTTVELGGKVEGPSLFAQELRERFESGKAEVAIWPQPDGNVPLDLNDVALLHAYLEAKIAFWNRVRNVVIRMRAKPENIPALPPPPWGDAPPEAGVFY